MVRTITLFSNKSLSNRTCKIILLILLVFFAAVAPSMAQGNRERGDHGHQDRDRDHRPFHGDIRHFHRYDFDVWRGGHWVHGPHDGRLGWWWVIGTLWFFYPEPIYPYPNPYIPPIVAPPPSAPPQYWYFCEESNNYYPYVQQCPGGWKLIPATPATPPPQ